MFHVWDLERRKTPRRKTVDDSRGKIVNDNNARSVVDVVGNDCLENISMLLLSSILYIVHFACIEWIIELEPLRSFSMHKIACTNSFVV